MYISSSHLSCYPWSNQTVKYFQQVLLSLSCSECSANLISVDVTNTGNGERGTGNWGTRNGSLGTSVQRQPSWEFKMAVKTKEKARRETIWVKVSFHRLCPQMASTFLYEQSPISTRINKACNGAWVENRIECQARVLNKSFQLSLTSIDTHKKMLTCNWD